MYSPGYRVPNLTNGSVSGAEELPEKQQEALSHLAVALHKCQDCLGRYQLNEILDNYDIGWRQHDPVGFNNGKSMSIQVGRSHYCSKELTWDGAFAFTTIEVWGRDETGKRETEEPEVITPYDLMKIVEDNGGIAYGSIPPLYFGRNPNRHKREFDSSNLDLKVRNSQRTGGLSLKRYRGRISKWRVKKNSMYFWLVGQHFGEIFRSSALVKQMFDDGIYKFETNNSIYVACEDDHIVVDANVSYSSDGRIRLSVTPSIPPHRDA